MPAIAVELSPPDPPPVLARALVDACSAAVASGACRIAGDEGLAPDTAVAIVRWEPGERSVRVQVGLRRGETPEWRGRLLHFEEADPLVERYRSVGLTLATLASEVERKAPLAAGEDAELGARTLPTGSAELPTSEGPPPKPGPAPAPAPAPTVSPAEPEPASSSNDQPSVRRPTGPSRFWISGSGFGGPAFSDGTVRYGAALDFGARPFSGPVFVRLSVAYAGRAQDGRGLAADFETVTAGLGTVLASGAFSVEPRVALGVDAVHAWITDAASSRADSGTRVAVGVHAGADGVLRAGRFAILVSLDGWQLASRTDILVENQIVATGPATGWAAGVGVRYYVE